MEPCSICKSPTEYEAQDKPICHRCAVVVLEYVRGVDFFHAFSDAQQYLQRTAGILPPEVVTPPEILAARQAFLAKSRRR
jgi:hypothetical protein